MTSAPWESSSPALEEKLDSLTDLVRRRLLDDREKRRMLDYLTERLEVAEKGAFRQFLHPVVAGLALLLDRCDRYEGPDPEFAASVRDELLDILGRHGVRPVPADGPVDTSLHEVVGVVEDEAVGSTPMVAELVRRGFEQDGWVFRPAQVVAAVAADPSAADRP